MKGLKVVRNIFGLIVLIFATIAIHSCGNGNAPQPTELEGFWILKSLNGNDAKSEFHGALPTISFNFQDSILSGTSGCNRYTGNFLYNRGELSAPKLASTQRLCIDANNEPVFLAILSKTNKLSIENNVLSFINDNQVVLEFVKDTISTNQEQNN